MSPYNSGTRENNSLSPSLHDSSEIFSEESDKQESKIPMSLNTSSKVTRKVILIVVIQKMVMLKRLKMHKYNQHQQQKNFCKEKKFYI